MDIFSGSYPDFKRFLSPPISFMFYRRFCRNIDRGASGDGPIGAMSILLPMSFGISTVSSIIMLAGIYYGAQYGRLDHLHSRQYSGEASSIVTCLDGYQMARKGRAGPALGIAAFGSLIGGTFSVIALMFLVLPLAQAALNLVLQSISLSSA